MATARITLHGSRDIPFTKLVLSRALLVSLERGRAVDAHALRAAMPSVAAERLQVCRFLPDQPPRRPAATVAAPTAVELADESVDWAPEPGRHLTDALYAKYGLQSIRIPASETHPTPLVQAAAMASVAPPKPNHRPHLPPAVIADGLSPDAQLESAIFAGAAPSGYLAGSWTIDDTFDAVSTAPDDTEDAVCFRRGWFWGDGTGTGKGRQVAGILLDHRLKGRRRAVWISKSDKLIEDAQRNWSALGQDRLLITPPCRFRQGAPVRLDQGILFAAYATLRSDAREEKVSPGRQIVDWSGRDFDRVIVFDESHAMQNAAGERSERGERTSCQQGRAGLRLQHALPNARVLYVSATGATTVHNLLEAEWTADNQPLTVAEALERACYRHARLHVVTQYNIGACGEGRDAP